MIQNKFQFGQNSATIQILFENRVILRIFLKIDRIHISTEMGFGKFHNRICFN